MKKTLLSILLLGTAFAANAKDFTDNLTVTINGESVEQSATVTVTYNDDNTIDFSLNNFMLTVNDNDMYVGNIALESIALTDNGTYSTFTYNDNTTIAAGDLEGVDEDSWVGPMLGDVPLVLSGKVSDDALYVVIDIDMTETLGQTINVVFGSDFTKIATFTDNLTVTINGESVEQSATVTVTYNDDNTIDFSLNNFMLTVNDNDMYVGNIALESIALTDNGTYSTFTYNDNTTIAAGDLEGVDEDSWVGPMLGDVPLVLSGKVSDDALYVVIDIDMTETLGQTINVVFGSDFTANAIKGVTADTATTADDAIYDLSGRRVAKAVKGIYVINGKKVLVK